MKVKDIVKKQNQYVRSQGGYSNIREADQTYNDMNRELIQAMADEYHTAYLGRYQFFGREKLRIFNGTDDVYVIYTGQAVDNFDTDFIVPTRDELLETMIRSFNAVGKTSNIKLIDRIVSRIYELDGHLTIWY